MTSPRLLFVGEAPATAGARPLHPDDCDSGRRLLEYTGWSRAEYLRLSDRTNLFDAPVKKWDAREALIRARDVHIGRYDYTVLLGRRVAATAAMRERQFFAPGYAGMTGWNVFVCPHPSGRNRWWNDEDNRNRARRFFNRLATELWTPQSSPCVSADPHAGGGAQSIARSL